jgi:hypothetical protein
MKMNMGGIDRVVRMGATFRIVASRVSPSLRLVGCVDPRAPERTGVNPAPTVVTATPTVFTRVVGALVSGCVARRAKSYVGEGFTPSRLARQGLTT